MEVRVAGENVGIGGRVERRDRRARTRLAFSDMWAMAGGCVCVGGFREWKFMTEEGARPSQTRMAW